MNTEPALTSEQSLNAARVGVSSGESMAAALAPTEALASDEPTTAEMPPAAPAAAASPVASAPLPAANLAVALPATDPTAAAAPVDTPAADESSPAGIPLPPSAQDADKIEPEWVNATESAIRATENDPYAEEEAIETVQVDYLNKRFGMHVKKGTSE